MSNKNDDRVLGRMGARELTELETGDVSGGLRFPPRCTFDLRTCVMDGVCTPPPAC